MRIAVRVKVPRLRPVLPGDLAVLRARIEAVRSLFGGDRLPRTSRLRQAATAMNAAEAARGGDTADRP